MNYSLGNMLGGSGGGVNSDRLSLDLQFAADKTLTARRGPTPTFTRASTATFVGSDGLIQSAALNTPRFDHDPVTLACKGLLIEEARTNLALQSEDFGTTWVSIGASVSVNAATSPNGLVTADKLILDLLSTTGRVQQATTLSGSHTFSAFLKASEWNWTFITPSMAVGGVWFNLSNGTIGTQQAGCVGSIVSYGNGWYRCSVTLTGTGSVSSTRVTPTNADNTITAGDGTSGIFAWGAQLEAGSFATSYIPTTTAALARSADVCSITGSAFTGFYNQSEGAMLVNAFTPASGDRTILSTDDNTANEMIRLRTEGTNPFFKVTDGGSEVVAIDAGTVVANTPFKLAGSYKVNDFASSINGGSAVTDTSGTIPTVDRMRIGAGQGGNTMCGCISSMRYFKKRVSDSRLQTLTT